VGVWPKFPRWLQRSIVIVAWVFVGLATWLFFDSFRYQWPKVADAQKLRQEATALCQKTEFPEREPHKADMAVMDRVELPKEQWPEAIAALQPRTVWIYHDWVSITTASTGRQGYQAWGYRVYRDGAVPRSGAVEKWSVEDEQPHR
jgi:hypothetical protein